MFEFNLINIDGTSVCYDHDLQGLLEISMSTNERKGITWVSQSNDTEVKTPSWYELIQHDGKMDRPLVLPTANIADIVISFKVMNIELLFSVDGDGEGIDVDTVVINTLFYRY